MTSKQLANTLYQRMISSSMFTDEFSDEQVELIIKLQQSFETDEERAQRKAHFKATVQASQIR